MEEMRNNISILKIMRQVRIVIKQSVAYEFEDIKLTGPQGMLIGALIHHGAMKISDLSKKLGLSNSTVSGIVDRLEKQGIVERTRNKDDKRVVLVSVTDNFKKDSKKHYDEVEQKFTNIVNQASPEEVNKIFEGLELLKKLLDKHSK